LAFYPGTVLYDKAVSTGLDVSARVKHADPSIGFNIILKEDLKHKFLHLLLLLMAGDVTRFRLGNVPRFLVGSTLLRMYAFIDRKAPKLTDALAHGLAFVFYHFQWKKIVKQMLGSENIAKIKRLVRR
jgi:hypothetical protein